MIIAVTENEKMADYIKRSDAIRIANGFCHPANVATEIEKLPAEDVVKVKGGMPCDLCRYKETGEDMCIYCPAEPMMEVNDG